MFQINAWVVQKLLYWIFITHTCITGGSGLLMGIWTFPKETVKFVFCFFFFFSDQSSGALKTKALPCNSVLWTRKNRSTLGFSKEFKGIRGQPCGSTPALLSRALRLFEILYTETSSRLFSSWSWRGGLTCNLGESGWLSWVSQGFELGFDWVIKCPPALLMKRVKCHATKLEKGSSRSDILPLKKCKLLCLFWTWSKAPSSQQRSFHCWLVVEHAHENSTWMVQASLVSSNSLRFDGNSWNTWWQLISWRNILVSQVLVSTWITKAGKGSQVGWVGSSSKLSSDVWKEFWSYVFAERVTLS